MHGIVVHVIVAHAVVAHVIAARAAAPSGVVHVTVEHAIVVRGSAARGRAASFSWGLPRGGWAASLPWHSCRSKGVRQWRPSAILLAAPGSWRGGSGCSGECSRMAAAPAGRAYASRER